MPESLSTVADLHFERDVFHDFPEGWKSVAGVADGFLLAKALEIEARELLDPHDPWGAHVTCSLPLKFQYDALGALVAGGPWHFNSIYLQLRPAKMDDFASVAQLVNGPGELIGRTVLMELIWRLLLQVQPATARTQSADAWQQFVTTNVELKHGLLPFPAKTLFMGTLESWWFSNTHPRKLSEVERSFLRGDLAQHNSGLWSPGGEQYLASIWAIARRLVERHAPGHFPYFLREKRETIEHIMTKRVEDVGGMDTTPGPYHWTGWPHEALDFASYKPRQPVWPGN